MSPVYKRRQRKFPWFWVGLALFALLGTAAVFSVGNGWLLSPVKKAVNKNEGKVAVPGSFRQLPAYKKVAREDLDWIYMDPDHIPPQVLGRLSDVLGRVLQEEKPAGYVFTESDFAPKGTRPGISAGIPAGKRAFTLDVSAINGARVMNSGDNIDLVAAYMIEPKHPYVAPIAQVQGGRLAYMQVLARNALVVDPVRTRHIPVSSTSLTRGVTTRTRPIQEMVIAVDPEEVSKIAKALAQEALVYCVPRSGFPEDEGVQFPASEIEEEASGLISQAVKIPQMEAVETIKGDKKERVAVPVVAP